MSDEHQQHAWHCDQISIKTRIQGIVSAELIQFKISCISTETLKYFYLNSVHICDIQDDRSAREPHRGPHLQVRLREGQMEGVRTNGKVRSLWEDVFLVSLKL